MRAEPDDPTPELPAVEARMRNLGERVRAKLEQEGKELVEERTERALQDSLRQALDEERPRAPTKRAAWIGLGTVAAALLAWFVFFELPRKPARQGVPLGPRRIELLRPVGDVPDFTEFEWRVDEVPRGGKVQLRFFDQANLDTPVRTVDADQQRWLPSDDVRSQLPDHLYWQVVILDALGDVVDSVDARAVRPASH